MNKFDVSKVVKNKLESIYKQSKKMKHLQQTVYFRALQYLFLI